MTKVAISCIAALAAATAASAASFDCKKASGDVERTVCGDPKLSDLDSRLGKAFAQAKQSSASDAQDAARVMAIARVFLSRQRACGTKRSCLIASYAGALDGYGSAGSTVEIPSWVEAPIIADGKAPPSKSLPTVAGRCVSTQVSEVTPRLGGDGPVKPEDFASGTAIGFANGGHQVSYSREPTLIASRRGDPVVMCLISEPQMCPPGDDRGKGYLVTNMRTHQTWTLGDSQHMCGGA